MDEARLDGTQAPPPPRTFPDPLAGLVTGEVPYRPGAAAPVAPVVSVVPVPAVPAPAYVAPVRRPPARRQAARVTGPPVQHDPHAELARRPPKPEPSAKKGKGGLVGCLAVLAVLGGLLFNVVVEIVEAVLDVLR